MTNGSSSYGTFASSLKLPERQTTKIVLAFSALALSCVIVLSMLAVSLEHSFVLEQTQATTATDDIQAFLKWAPSDITAMIDSSTNPCVDFHQFACGQWDKTAVIPGDKTSISYSWEKADTRTNDNLKLAVEQDQGGLVGNYYAACLNLDLANKLGVAPALPYFKLVDTIVDTKSLADVIAQLHVVNMDVFFSWFIGTDHTNSQKTLMYFSDGGIQLPDKAYYLESSAEYLQHRQAYRVFLVKALGEFGVGESLAQKIVNDTIAIETDLAEHEKDEDNAYKLTDSPPRFNAAAFKTKFPNFDWTTYFSAWGKPDLAADQELLSVTRPNWMSNLNSVFAARSLDSLKNYLRAHIVYYFAPMLTETLLGFRHDLDKDLYGVNEMPPRWKKCLGAVQNAIPLAVGKLYVDRYVPATVKDRATSMILEIKSAFEKNLDTVAWMSPEVRKLAKDKLNGIFFEVAYPSTWPEYTFRTRNDTYFNNAMAAFSWTTRDQFTELFKPVNRREWSSSPVEINAFYSNGVNGVFIPAGILQNPFFDVSMPDAHNYGAMGAVMGHELTHGFDNTGRQYDALGNKHQWWDGKTIAEYDSRSQCIARLFNTYTVANVSVHGNDTLGEDIADLGGLKVAYRALLEKQPTDNANHKKLFWTSFAQSWCSVKRDKAMKLQVLSDPHAPDKFRILGPLSQMPDFSADFKCPVGTPMNPPEKCVLW